MTFPQILALSGTRLRRPGTWGAVALFGFLWNALRWFAGPGHLSVGECLLPFLLGALVLGVSAAPWQWSGDERPLAPTLRGLAQALPWNLLLLILLGFLVADPGHRGGRGANAPAFMSVLPPRLLVLLVASGAFGLLAGWILADRDLEAQKGAAQARLTREAEALALQARMNPHVLFNTLSGLAELAREDGEATEKALVSLAAMLRQLLEHSGRTRVSLDEERGLVEGLLRLEQFRLGGRLRVRWVWDSNLEDAEVPPLLLQPLVENAIKHGIGPSREGGEVEIGLAGQGTRLHLWVANTGLPLPASEGSGTGLENLRRRLALLEGREARLELRSEGERTIADLYLEPDHG
jgi:two-component sensor histidine kinase